MLSYLRKFLASGKAELNVQFTAEETKALLAPANLDAGQEALVVEALQ